MMTKTDL